MASFWELVRDWAESLHIPNFLQSFSGGVRTTFVPLFARQLGSTDSQLGFIIGSAGIVKVVFDMFFAFATSVYGTRLMMVAGMLLNALGGLVATMAWSPFVLALASMLWGAGVGLFFVARHVFIAKAVPRSICGRLMSVVGGIARWCSVLGPGVAGVLTDICDIRVTAFSIVPMSLGCAYMMAKNKRIREVDEGIREEKGTHSISKEFHDMMHVLRNYWEIIARVGFYSLIIICLRQCRGMLLVIAAMNMGLSSSMVGLVLVSSYSVDATFFFLGGYIMDKCGQSYVTIPTSINLGIAFFILSNANSLASLILASVFFGVAESTSSGMLLSLTANHSPSTGRAPFMGLIRTVQDSGQVLGPVASGVIMDCFGFASVCYVMGAVGMLSAPWAYFLIPEKPPCHLEEEAANVSEGSATVISLVTDGEGKKDFLVVDAEGERCLSDEELPLFDDAVSDKEFVNMAVPEE
ncbi:transporter [Trypanosoma cruzi cruzi]|uniref:Putative transporter n=1 Tax=Trypanosoma cruzi TaxID=5693 RepID=A0A2V2UHT4_TRYCR|nr:transporter [Trypanosoma cruzi cruzi]PBJ76598.1 transporter [Trypanosoma cruzi cruzi]PWU83827.1 putative transporter [Trypanosoma cruzi]